MQSCPCCGNTTFNQTKILWKGLVREWKLSKEEVVYIDKQQGYCCSACGSNLRSMTIAAAINSIYEFDLLQEFVAESSVSVLEVNEAGHLNQFFNKMQNHILAEYPEIDIAKLPYKDNSFDLVVHSDTLEHVDDPVKALKETLRVLKPGGHTVYSIPVVVGRLSKKRTTPSYHGSPGNQEYLVKTEYGSDMWTELFLAGFNNCQLLAIEFPSSVAIIARKQPVKPTHKPKHPVSVPSKNKSQILKTIKRHASKLKPRRDS